MLEVSGVEKSYGDVKALRGVDLVIAPGEIMGLLGPNGAGKTSLVSIVAGLRRPDRGEVRVGGIDVARRPSEARTLIGLAPQEIGVYPTVRVRDNLVFFGELYGLRRQALQVRIDEVAAALGLTELLDRRGGELSGGERRRLHTAMALLHKPPLLLLDEPTAGADVRTRADLLALVTRMAGDGTAVCYSTHYLPEVETLGAKVTLIENGRVIAQGPVAQLVAAHSQAAVELVFDGPAPEVTVNGHVERDGSTLRIRSDEPAVTAAMVMAGLGGESRRLLSMEILRPSLESVYLTLTGRRYEGDVDQPEESDAVRA